MVETPGTYWIDAAALREGTRAAIRFEGAATTFEALAIQTYSLAAVLRRCGVGAGDRIALLHRAHPFWAVTLHACQRLGATLVGMNERLPDAELRAQLAHAEANLLIVDRSCEGRASALGMSRVEIAEELSSYVAGGASTFCRLVPDRPLVLLYTSGTTGRPKGVLLGTAQFNAAAKAHESHFGVTADDAWLAALPLFHVGGLSILVRGAVHARSVVLHDRFDAARIDRSLREDAITLTSMVPTMLRRLLDVAASARYPDSLRAVLLGGGPVPADLVRRARERALAVHPTYGLTESTAQVCTADPSEVAAHPERVGRPLAGVSLRILAPDASGAGEIAIRGPSVMLGYHGDLAATAAAVREGWLHTGDFGRCHDDGSLEILERRVDLIVSGGENVLPSKVEAVLLEHPAILDAGVFGQSDDEWGRRVCAALVLRGGEAEPTAASLRGHCRSRLSNFETPREWRFVDALPRTASGKLQRHRLADDAP